MWNVPACTPACRQYAQTSVVSGSVCRPPGAPADLSSNRQSNRLALIPPWTSWSAPFHQLYTDFHCRSRSNHGRRWEKRTVEAALKPTEHLASLSTDDDDKVPGSDDAPTMTKCLSSRPSTRPSRTRISATRKVSRLLGGRHWGNTILPTSHRPTCSTLSPSTIIPRSALAATKSQGPCVDVQTGRMHAVLRRQRVFGHIPLYSSTAHYISFYFALPDVVWLDDVIHTASNAAGGILMDGSSTPSGFSCRSLSGNRALLPCNSIRICQSVYPTQGMITFKAANGLSSPANEHTSQLEPHAHTNANSHVYTCNDIYACLHMCIQIYIYYIFIQIYMYYTFIQMYCASTILSPTRTQWKTLISEVARQQATTSACMMLKSCIQIYRTRKAFLAKWLYTSKFEFSSTLAHTHTRTHTPLIIHQVAWVRGRPNTHQENNIATCHSSPTARFLPISRVRHRFLPISRVCDTPTRSHTHSHIHTRTSGENKRTIGRPKVN